MDSERTIVVVVVAANEDGRSAWELFDDNSSNSTESENRTRKWMIKKSHTCQMKWSDIDRRMHEFHRKSTILFTFHWFSKHNLQRHCHFSAKIFDFAQEFIERLFNNNEEWTNKSINFFNVFNQQIWERRRRRRRRRRGMIISPSPTLCAPAVREKEYHRLHPHAFTLI